MRVRVEPVTEEQYERILPLIAGYQRFYGADPDPRRNAAFFRRFLAPSDDGLLLAAWDGPEAAGHACLYWTFSSVAAEEVVHLNDLFVTEERRGAGVGRRLIEAAADVARSRGARRLTWMTAPDNLEAQRLYERTGAARSAWLEYELEVT